MDAVTIAALAATAVVGYLIMARISILRRTKEVTGQIGQEIRVRELLEAQNEIERLHKEGTRSSEAFTQAMEKYNEKYRRNRPAPPASKPSDS